VLNDAREEVVDLFVAVHRAHLVVHLVLHPVVLELVFLHVYLVSQLLVLVLILELQNLELAINSVFLVLILLLLLLGEEHEGARKELVPGFEHLVRREDLARLPHLSLVLQRDQLLNRVRLRLLIAHNVVIEE